MRMLFYFVCFMATFAVQAQVFVCKDGITKFTSEAPLELIKAQSDKTNGVIDTKARNVAFSIDVESFRGFNSELQREHFLENYLETVKYPKATFKGKIIEEVDFSKKGTTTVRSKGTFTIHGVEKEKIVKVKLTIRENGIDVEATFDLPLEDHSIKVPKVVNQKIAPVILVDVKANLKLKA